jgi:hypothetical protein
MVHFLLSTAVLFLCRKFLDLGFIYSAPLFCFFSGWLDWVLLSMEGFPLSVGGGGNAGPSNRPLLDLNLPPAPEPEPGPEPAPPAPLSAEEEEALRTKRERVKAELRLLLQIGYDKRARSSKTAEDLIRWIGIDAERDPRFLESLYNHLDRLSLTQGGSVGQPQKLSKKGQAELCRWILEQKENGAGGPGGDD